MVSSTFARVCFNWFAIMILLQPMFSQLDYFLDTAVKANAEYAAQKAAPNGTMTEEVRTRIRQNLAAVGFNPDSINIEATGGIKSRGETMEVVIRAPRIVQSFIYKFGTTEPPTQYFAHTYTTSEYIP